MARRVIVGVALAVAVVLACAAVAGASSASGWHVGYYNNSQLSNAQAAKGAGIASLTFTSNPNTALLVTNQKSLTGDLTGKTITATASLSGVTGSFTYYGEPDGCGTPANVRLYFETSNAGGFDYTHYWWANPNSMVLTPDGAVTLTATVEPAEWSDWNGTRGTDAEAGFTAAAANVTNIGVSFGGGCFFENGVGTTDGSGTFTLSSFGLGS